MHCSEVQCSEVQFSEVQLTAVQCCAVLYSVVQCCAVLCSAVQCTSVQCSAVQRSAAQCSTVHHRNGKTYERASNACVKNFLAWIKSVPNFTMFCRKNELCRNFARCRVVLMPFKLVNCLLLLLKEENLLIIT